MAEIKARPDPFRVSDRAARRIGEILARDGDIAIERDGAKVVIDGMSLMYMLGCEVDYVEDLTGSYFRVSNPNATASCGCGNSFAV